MLLSRKLRAALIGIALFCAGILAGNLSTFIDVAKAQSGQTPAYLVANYRITDADAYSAYGPVVRPTLASHGAEVLVADPETEAIEGEPDHVTVVVRFPSKEAAHSWYQSSEYQNIVNLRTDNSVGFLVFANGLGAPPQ